MKKIFGGVYSGLPVLVTGHTGFKGSWLTAWLLELGADVTGFSLPDPPTTPSNFELMRLGSHINDVRGNICDYGHFQETVRINKPELIFHMAAQPIVLHGVEHPRMTMDVNSQGTIHVMEAVRATDSARALVCVTTDKVYKNQGWVWGYRETDELGGHEPYGASKAMAELAITAYRETFFPVREYEKHGVALASVRAGNVIGGGDFADFRLVPDCMQALMKDEPIGIRNPMSVRPWQHVLEPLSGYLLLGERLLRQGREYAEAWNFGPKETRGISSQELVEKLIEIWGRGTWEHIDPGYAKIETGLLRLSWEKAADRLGWQPAYSWEEALSEIAAWYKSLMNEDDMHDVCCRHIVEYISRARLQNITWSL